MNCHYSEILAKMGEPIWWDEHAVPRFIPFSPDLVANIYAEEVALVLIECQSCQHPFKVVFSSADMDRVFNPEAKPLSESLSKEDGCLDYGDPPCIFCCPSGPTMSSTPKKVLEFWRHDVKEFKWVRVPELEKEFHDDDAD